MGENGPSYFFLLFSVLQNYQEMDFTQVLLVKLTLFLLATHKFHFQLVAKYIYYSKLLHVSVNMCGRKM